MLVLLIGTTIAPVRAEPEVDYWLDRMARAVETLNYRGTLVHTRDGHVDTFRIIHRADENGVRERIYSVDGQPREILRDGKHVRTLLGGDQALVIQGGLESRLLPNLPPSRLSRPILAYRMSFVGTDRVAGLSARVLEIRPRDRFRYGHRFWLEENTGMLLRTALMDHKGNYLQQLSFVALELGVPISDGELEPVLHGEDSIEVAMDPVAGGRRAAAIELHRATWSPRHLPDGFRLASVGRGQDVDGREFEHLVFSDGLASFSVYIEEIGSEQESGHIQAVGAVHVYTGRIDHHRVTVVGEVPSATVALIAQQLQRRSDDGVDE